SRSCSSGSTSCRTSSTPSSTPPSAWSEPAVAERQRSLWTDALRRLRRDRLAVASLAVILLYVLIALGVWTGAIAGDWNKASKNPAEWHQPPGWHHPFGTDIEGKDILSRTLCGAKIA